MSDRIITLSLSLLQVVRNRIPLVGNHADFRAWVHLTLVTLLPALSSLASSVSASPPPNIVMIISDDQSWTDYGFMGHPDIRTPRLDELARQSCLFRRGYVPVALCRPSLATMVTGLYPHQHGITGNDPTRTPGMSNEEYAQLRERLIAKLDRFDTVPDLLTEAGYLAHQSGKWWEGSYQRGGFTHGMTRGFPQRRGRHGDDGLKIGREDMDSVFEFVDMAVDQQKPFFLWYAPFLPHTPHNPPQRLLDHYASAGRDPSMAKYYAMCEWFDETCGQLLDHLAAAGVTDNTIIVYVTDNGWIQRTADTEVPDGWRPGFAPRSKQSPNEGGTRTPILVRWPQRLKPADRPEPISSIDLVPTMLAAAGVRIPENLPGFNLLPALTARRPLPERPVFGEGSAHDVADVDDPEASLLYRWVIDGQWKLLLTYDGKVNRYGPVHLREERRPQLFDLLADPHERTNLARDNPDIVARLAARLKAWYPVLHRTAETTFAD